MIVGQCLNVISDENDLFKKQLLSVNNGIQFLFSLLGNSNKSILLRVQIAGSWRNEACLLRI